MEHALKKKLYHVVVEVSTFTALNDGNIKTIIVPLNKRYNANDLVQVLCSDGINSGTFQILSLAQHDHIVEGYQLVTLARLMYRRL